MGHKGSKNAHSWSNFRLNLVADHSNPTPGTGQRIPNGMLEDTYPRNMWWVAARSDKVTDKPLARWLLETPVVLYRLADGTPAALYKDKHLLEKMQAVIEADPRGLNYLEVTLGADDTGIKVRQILNKKLAAEGSALG